MIIKKVNGILYDKEEKIIYKGNFEFGKQYKI